MDHVTVLENPLIGVTVQLELPAIVASFVIPGQAGVKSWTVTLTVVLLDNVLGAVPVVPVTGTLNDATPMVHVTDKTAPENEPLHPVGNVKPELIAKETVPANPLIGVTATVEVPATVARVVIAGPAREKSWTLTETLAFLDSVVGAVPVVRVIGTVKGV